MRAQIALLPGDGIGPEIMAEAVRVLAKVEKVFGHSFNMASYPMGGVAFDEAGDPFPEKTKKACVEADGVLLGAVGGPKWENLSPEQRPERGLLRLRSEMGVFANLRPAKIFPELAGASPLHPDIVMRGIDFVVVRELIGGVYFGEHSTALRGGVQVARDIMEYSEPEIVRIARVAFESAKKRRGHVTSVDKANVLDTSRLWRKVVGEMAKDFLGVTLSHMLVDNAAMQMLKDPAQFDVILTENMFGDILSDEASMITGSIGMIPSASLGEGSRGLYEPIHGSAPDIAGKDVANPIGMILSAAMLLRYSLGLEAEAMAIESAVSAVLSGGTRTADITVGSELPVGCAEMGRRIAANIGL